MAVSPDGSATSSHAAGGLLPPPQPPPHRTLRNITSQNNERSHRRDDTNSASKLAEAMKNPDWRRRDGTARSSESTALTECSEVRKVPTRRHDQSESAESQSGWVFASWKQNPVQPLDYTAPEPYRHLQSESSCVFDEPDSQLSVGSVTDDSATHLLEGEELDLAEIVRYVNVPEVYADNKNLKLIDVVPCVSKNGNSRRAKGPSNTVVRVQKIERAKQPEIKQQKSSLQSQLNDALAASKTTPTKVKPATQPHQQSVGRSADAAAAEAWVSGLEKARHAVLADPAIANVRNSVRRPGTSEFSNTEADKRTNEDKYLRGLHAAPQDPAFLKMLNKLQSGGQSKTKEARQPLAELQLQAGAWKQPEALSSAEAKKLQFKRQVWSRDSALGSDMNSSESSGDPALSMNLSPHSNVFNPKAREFLSLNPEASPDYTEELPRPQIPLHIWTSPRQSPSIEGYVSSASACTAVPNGSTLPPYIPISQPLSHFNNGLNAIPRAMPAYHSVPLSPFFAPAGFEHLSPVMPMFKPTPSPGLGASSPMAQFPNGLAGGLPTPSLSPALMQTLLSGLQPGHPLYQPAQVQPQPAPPEVSKPRKPDPGDQIAYEAWIEWRKAHEPGYAIGCKIRQQRRIENRHKA